MKIIITVDKNLPQYLTYAEDKDKVGDYTQLNIAGDYKPADNTMYDIDFDYR